MKSISRILLFSIFLCLSLSLLKAQRTYYSNNNGYVNFNLGTTTLIDTSGQYLSLYGCNTSINIDKNSLNWPEGFKWNTSNQVLSNVPFGFQKDAVTQEEFYVSKYYIASPPVFKKGGQNDPNTLYDIGIVTPDQFVFEGKKPVQMVYMDYNILQPMYIEYIDIEFESSFENVGYGLVPFKVECRDFPWISANGINNAQGASGIGALRKDSTNIGRLFLPYYYENNPEQQNSTITVKNYLDCEVTILNDILFNYEVYFVVNGELKTSINLKDLKNEKIKFRSVYREELPEGCKEFK